MTAPNTAHTTTAAKQGKIAQVIGPVVDVEFAGGERSAGASDRDGAGAQRELSSLGNDGAVHTARKCHGTRLVAFEQREQAFALGFKTGGERIRFDHHFILNDSAPGLKEHHHWTQVQRTGTICKK